MSDSEHPALPQGSEENCPQFIEDLAELYVLGRLPRADAEPLELHLIGCSSCQNVVEEAELFISAIRKAAERLDD